MQSLYSLPVGFDNTGLKGIDDLWIQKSICWVMILMYDRTRKVEELMMKKMICVMLAAVMLSALSAAALADAYGLGVVTSIASSKAATAEATGVAQADTTICAVVLDEEGKIVQVIFDVAQTRIAINNQGEITSDTAAEVQTKVEAGAGYGLRGASGIEKEMYEQIAALEAWCVGKTVDEAVTKASGDADLLAGCTIGVNAFMQALVKAAANAK